MDSSYSIIPSTLYQVMKYVDEDEKVRILIVERHPFKGVENYFTDSLLYQDSLEIGENPQQRNLTLIMKLTLSQR